MKRLLAAMLGTAIALGVSAPARAEFSDLSDSEIASIYDSDWSYFRYRRQQSGRSGYSIYQLAESGNMTIYQGRSYQGRDGSGFVGIAEISCPTMQWRLVQYMTLDSDEIGYDPTGWVTFDWDSKEQQTCAKAAEHNLRANR